MVTVHATQTASDSFEAIYAEAMGDGTRVPWARMRPHPGFVTWLNVRATSLIRCGARVAVIGCGLGDDARELIHRGYDVTAFDCSETAIGWAQELDPENAHCYVHEDLFDLPARWRRRFDLAVEISTLESLSPDRRPEAMRAIVDLLSPHGHLLVICRGTDEPLPYECGPPGAVTPEDLAAAASSAGLTEVAVADYVDDETPPVRRLRVLYRRA